VEAATGDDTIAPIANMRQPDFRADGQLVLAKGFQGDKTSVWTIDANTGTFIREQSPFADDYHPFWSPDGSMFVYDSLHQGKGEYNIYRNVLDSKVDQVLNTGSLAAVVGRYPVWMHDDWVAFAGCDWWLTGGSCGIYRLPSWSGRPTAIQTGGLSLRPTDNHGELLLYMSQEGGDWEVYVIPNQGGQSRSLSDGAGSHDGLGTFSPDGKMVAFVSNRGGSWAVWAVRIDGSGLTRLFNLPGPLTGDWTDERISWGP
jgi:Tol biopolymer transport system component